jgi:hypothetical protein
MLLVDEVRNKQEGFIQIIRKDPSGKIDLVYTKPNLITYDATNLMAAAIAGQGSAYVNKIAIQHYTNIEPVMDNDDPGLVPLRTDRLLDLSSDPDITVVTLPVLATVFSSIPTTGDPPVKLIQRANAVTFTTAIDDDNGASMNDRFVLGAGLVGVVNGEQVLFAHQYFPLIEKLPFFQLLINWTIRFS